MTRPKDPWLFLLVGVATMIVGGFFLGVSINAEQETWAPLISSLVIFLGSVTMAIGIIAAGVSIALESRDYRRDRLREILADLDG